MEKNLNKDSKGFKWTSWIKSFNQTTSNFFVPFSAPDHMHIHLRNGVCTLCGQVNKRLWDQWHKIKEKYPDFNKL